MGARTNINRLSPKPARGHRRENFHLLKRRGRKRGEKVRKHLSHHYAVLYNLLHGDFLTACLWSGPATKKMKKGEFKVMTKEELKKNRQQRKKELKKNRQQAERKDMFEIICQAKQVWGSLRRYTHSQRVRVEPLTLVALYPLNSPTLKCERSAAACSSTDNAFIRVNRKDCDDDMKKKLMKGLDDLIRGKIKQVSLQSRFPLKKARAAQDGKHRLQEEKRWRSIWCVDPVLWNLCLQMAFAHDSVRVLQCFIQFGSHEQRMHVYEELKGELVFLHLPLWVCATPLGVWLFICAKEHEVLFEKKMQQSCARMVCKYFTC